jgi:hypothetical protein
VEEVFRRAGGGWDVPISWPETLTNAIRRVFFVSGAYLRDRMPILMGMPLSGRHNKILQLALKKLFFGPDWRKFVKIFPTNGSRRKNAE